MRDFIEARAYEYTLLEPSPQIDARLQALAEMLQLVGAHPDDAELRIERERDALVALGNMRTDDRLLWARIAEYQAVLNSKVS